MSIEVKVPVLPESVSDATVAAWHKKPGDAVRRDENIVDLETDKVVLEVPSPTDGVLTSIKFESGSSVKAGQIIAIIEAGAAAAPTASKAAAKPAAAAANETKTETASAAATAPAARKLMAENKLDANNIAGSGKDGRISKEDVVNHLEKPATSKTAPAVSPVSLGARSDKRVPMTRMRARIAERLLEAKHTTAMLTTFNEVDMQPVMNLRTQYKDQFEKKHGVKLGFMSFFVKATTEALKRFPEVNASVDGSDIVYHAYCDIGVAVSGPRGLVVPILRSTENMSLATIESSIVEYGNKSKNGSLSMEDMTGGTFTISNGGIFGSLNSTPILNPPQSAILGMHKIQERPVVVNSQIVIRPMMYLALSYDHRIVDGREAVQFLVTIKDLLEDPARILLDV
ncbi:MAG: 2-oxoglutarate dehydrogenase complex dihydrolipoyllysine-residue succinyltransferase [Gammaproteobacteria bacterium]|nr:2-oxoglutarate dehydrogenase complex dihydrolipoyllysine-residue succinyltransferase [Gammaproteobacteria bacterium]